MWLCLGNSNIPNTSYTRFWIRAGVGWVLVKKVTTCGSIWIHSYYSHDRSNNWTFLVTYYILQPRFDSINRIFLYITSRKWFKWRLTVDLYPTHSFNLLATASLDGTVSVWDLNSGRIRHQCKHPVSLFVSNVKVVRKTSVRIPFFKGIGIAG